MKIFKIIIFSVLFFFVSCKDKPVQSDIDSENITTINEHSIEEESTEKEDFIIIPQESIFKNEPSFQGDGPSFFVNFDIKNNTPNTIDKFLVKVKIGAEFKDGTFQTFPRKERKIKVDLNDITVEQYLEDVRIYDFKKYPSDFHVGVLETDEKWESGIIKNFSLIIGDTRLGAHDSRAYFNINSMVFERTPKKLYLIFHYRAIGIDGEYENIMIYDILEYWKDYQTEIGLR